MVPAGRPGSPVPERNKVGRLDSRDPRVSGYVWRRQAPGPGFLGPLSCRRDVGRAQLDAQTPGSESRGELDFWGPMLRTGRLGTLISDPRWCECSGGVSKPLFRSRSG